MGFPVEHSRSPLIHNHWLAAHGIAGEYRREAIRPEDFPAFLAGLADRGYVGGNVTMPLKDLALAHSEPDERALAVGAANTLWLDGGRLRSTNTDVEGFAASLDGAAPGWDQAPRGALVLGAGGAARAVVLALLERGVPQVLVANRTPAKAEALRTRFGPRVEAIAWEDSPAALAGAGLVVNSTSLGMEHQPALDLDLSPLPEDAVVADLVYVPLETPLLAAARARGLRVADGLGMLLHQAGRGFELWFGVRPAVTDELCALVLRDMGLADETDERKAGTR